MPTDDDQNKNGDGSSETAAAAAAAASTAPRVEERSEASSSSQEGSNASTLKGAKLSSEAAAAAAAASPPRQEAVHVRSSVPFRMKIKTLRKRKRKNAGISSSSSSSSSESSDESGDEDTALRPAAAASASAAVSINSNLAPQQQHPGDNSDDGDDSSHSNHKVLSQQQQHQQQQQQPNGWRVKLYRLNDADGSWDDCGTGRIVCLYRTTKNNNSQDSTARTNNNKSATSLWNAQAPSSPPPSNDNDIDEWLHHETGDATLCVHAEVTTTQQSSSSQKQQSKHPCVLLRTRILLHQAYQRQGENIITWCEPYYETQQQHDNAANTAAALDKEEENAGGGGVDLALSFQDNAGCLDIWRQITHVQGRAAELLRQHASSSNDKSSSVEDMAAQVAARHHADLQRRQQQQQHDLWTTATTTSSGEEQRRADDNLNTASRNKDIYGGTSSSQEPPPPGSSNSLMEAAAAQEEQQQLSLPSPPTLQNIDEIADTIAALQHVQQRENLALWIAQDECSYLKQLLALFPQAEQAQGNDYGKLATLAACVKTILLLNDPSILELIVSVASIFEQVCSCLEYDPDLREKANHRWFLRERAKFRTVVPMEDPDLVAAIHRSFRVNYLRDTLLRPTMDESSLSTLSSLQTFAHADVIKGVTMAGNEQDGSLYDSYLVRIIDMLCVELHALSTSEWAELETRLPTTMTRTEQKHSEAILSDPSIVVGKHSLGATTWKQYLAPQDNSLSSRRLRRRGCLSFLKELFNMVRLSLQQSDKEDFFSVICSLEIDLNEAAREISDNVSQTSQIVEVGSVASTVKSDRLDEKADPQHPIDTASPSLPPTNLLSMLGNVLADPNADVSEKGSALEIISDVAMHDPRLIRRHCLEFHEARKKRQEDFANASQEVSMRPEPNEKKQVIFFCPPNNLISSLLFLLDIETDAGVLLQVSEIMRIILDTDMMNEHGPLSAGFADESEAIPPRSNAGPVQQHGQHNQPSGSGPTSTEQKQFLSLFYEHYVEWLVAPFQFEILYPTRRVPDNVLLNSTDCTLMQFMANFRKGILPGNPLLKSVEPCAIRSSFAVELLSFCARAHLHRMKFFLLKSRVLGNVLKLLRPYPRGISGDRCLKLAALRFLRAILSINDEFYHRHIIQHDLFAPVFEALRSNPVGDNLVSSAIVEMCDYIHSENIKSLIEYIVTKHLSASHPENTVPSLEDVSSPYVSTLTVLRKAYEANLNAAQKAQAAVRESGSDPASTIDESRYFPGGAVHHAPRQLSGKALEDQRKFQEVDEEESYFECDDDDGPERSTVVPPAVDEVDAQHVESELRRTPRMFSLAQAPLLNNLEESASSNDRENGKEGGSSTDGKESETLTEHPAIEDEGREST